METLTSTTETFESLRKNLHISTLLIGNDVKHVDPEYILAISEFACMASGVNTDHKEALIALVIELAYTKDPTGNVNALIRDMEASAALIGPNPDTVATNRPDYFRALSERACAAAGISGEHAESVSDLLADILTTD